MLGDKLSDASGSVKEERQERRRLLGKWLCKVITAVTMLQLTVKLDTIIIMHLSAKIMSPLKIMAEDWVKF